jgi:thymidine phosphorylase
MSKKIAAGIGGLVLDVKTGHGAFMKTEVESRRLAESLVSLGQAAGVRTEAYITAMDAPLGRAVGNALEVIECIETLKGHGPAALETLSVLLAARLLVLAGLESTTGGAERRVREAIASGAGVEKFRQIIMNQGGDPRVIDDYRRLPAAPHRQVIVAPRDGYLVGVQAELIGRATMALGAGRLRVEDTVDHAVGAIVLAVPGDRVRRGDPMIELHYRGAAELQAALPLATRAIQIGDAPPSLRPLVLDTIAAPLVDEVLPPP